MRFDPPIECGEERRGMVRDRRFVKELFKGRDKRVNVEDRRKIQDKYMQKLFAIMQR